MIEKAGAKGLHVGGALVSSLHGNFIVNEGGKASDVRALIDAVKEKVYKETGHILEEELRFIPYEG